MVAKNRQRRSYHHGDLRDALILAAAELITERGNLDFAMIDAARRAGVSSAAPYRHFRDKGELLAAVADLLFLGLSNECREAAEQAPPGSVERIVCLGKAYIHYLLQRPEFYQLMWGEHSPHLLAEPESDPKATGFYLLVASVEQWCRRHGVEGQDPTELATKLWAIAHGFTGLGLHRHIEKFQPGADIDALLESTTQNLLDGLRQGRR
jgi:AcrR family transcriptional regulator